VYLGHCGGKTRYPARVKYDLVDRRCVVTGATSGIGREIARNLAYFGATVVLACRDRDRGSIALQDIADDSGNDHITMLQVDLSSQTSIRQFVHRLTAGEAPVHVLVNCAAILRSERTMSADDIELTWSTNALSYFTLANLLLPTLHRTGKARVVNVASNFAGKLDLDDLEFEKRRYSGIVAYQQSKQANRMLTWALQRRVTSERVSVHACHPGSAATNLYAHYKGLRGTAMRLATRFMKSASEGSMTPTFLAADPDVHEQSGQYWIEQKPVDCQFRDETAEEALWAKCVEMTGTDVG
jgi:NAD(P)-dependent dehydrogenase (short-subunit alcohol dehydrogenase family)